MGVTPDEETFQSIFRVLFRDSANNENPVGQTVDFSDMSEQLTFTVD